MGCRDGERAAPGCPGLTWLVAGDDRDDGARRPSEFLRGSARVSSWAARAEILGFLILAPSDGGVCARSPSARVFWGVGWGKKCLDCGLRVLVPPEAGRGRRVPWSYITGSSAESSLGAAI